MGVTRVEIECSLCRYVKRVLRDRTPAQTQLTDSIVAQCFDKLVRERYLPDASTLLIAGREKSFHHVFIFGAVPKVLSNFR